MTISKNQVVQFHYSLKDSNGAEIESTASDEPMAYLHGYGNIFRGMENALEGKAAGDTLSVTLEAKDAYGERQTEELKRIPLKHLRGARKWTPGMMAWVETDKGNRQVTVVKVGKFNADVDVNHPLAGKTLTFDIQIVDLRDATAEEIGHGHAHGVGGHHH